MSRDFNKFRFEGLDYKTSGKSHWSMKRISDDESKIIVDVAPEQIFGTKYGFGLILDRTHVCFVKDWNVLAGMYGHTLVILSKQYFKAKEFGERGWRAAVAGAADVPRRWRVWDPGSGLPPQAVLARSADCALAQVRREDPRVCAVQLMGGE